MIGPDRHRRHRMPLGGALICRGIWRSVGTERLAAARFSSHGKLTLAAAALGSSCGEEARGLFGELFRKLEVRAVPGIRVEDQPGIR